MEFTCTSCGKRLRIPDGLRNPRVRCPHCKLVSRPLAGRSTLAAPSSPTSPPVSTRPLTSSGEPLSPGRPASAGSRPAEGRVRERPPAPQPQAARRPSSASTARPSRTAAAPARRPSSSENTGTNWGGCLGIALFLAMFLFGRIPDLVDHLRPKKEKRGPDIRRQAEKGPPQLNQPAEVEDDAAKKKEKRRRLKRLND